MKHLLLIASSITLFFALMPIGVSAEDNTSRLNVRSRMKCELANPQITESSGLATSRRSSGVYWTHNDSGDSPRIFAFDDTGKDLGECRIRGAEAVDWEDMASFDRHGKSWLLLADVGDNALRRPFCTLYLCEEPTVRQRDIDALAVRFRYEDGPQNCEAVAVDSQSGMVLLVSKFSGTCKVYQFELPEKQMSEPLVAKSVGTLAIPLVTAMDISADGRRAIILTYADAFQFERTADESWQQALARPPVHVPMPIRRQGESICYGLDGLTLYLTSERTPTPLWEIVTVNGKD